MSDPARAGEATRLAEMKISLESQTVFARICIRGATGTAWQLIHRGGQDPSLCIAHGESVDANAEGMIVADGLLLEPVNESTVLAAARWASARIFPEGGFVETGIKAVDLLCPLADGGACAFVGGPGQGRVVLLQELYERLRGKQVRQSLVFLIEPGVAAGVPEMIAADAGFPPDAEGGLVSLWLVTDRAADPTVIPGGNPWTTRFVFSAEEAAERNYPALDMALSQPLVERAWRDLHHREMAGRVRTSLADRSTLVALQLRSYLSQPFYVAAEPAGVEGNWVTLDETLVDCERILAGELTGAKREDLYMVGALG